MSKSNSIVLAVDGGAARLLVADDEVKNRKLLQDILEAQGHRVTPAEDGQQALEKALANPPDVILLDVMMPRMDGYEVCAQLRKDSRTAHLPILMITALKNRNDRLKGIQAGANDFLTKPIDAEEIRLRVKNAVLTKRLYDKVQDDYARLSALETLRDNLTSMIVHDMRSPLMGISGSFDILLMDKDRFSPDQQQIAAMGQSSCHELIEMVTSLLDVSRMESGQMPLNRVPCNIRDIAQKAVTSVAFLAQAKKVTLRVTGDLAGADVDRDILHRIFINLFWNAIKFSPDGGTIGIGIAATGDVVRVTVTDQGHGIPPEYHQRIFEKFGQVEACKENKMYSTGLGLTFCKLAVEAHGGQIGVDSQIDQGSRFWFTLPTSPIGTPDRERKKIKIMLVDDDTRLLKTLAAMLGSTGLYEVCTVDDNMSAIKVACKFLPDIAILDIQMPDISGREIARQLRQDALTQYVAVVFLTSLLRKKGQTSKMDVDGCPVLGKPASLDELNQAIGAAFERRKKNAVGPP